MGIALLGFGASGTLLALTDRWRRASLGDLGAGASAGFALSLLAAHAYFARVSPSLARTLDARSAAAFGVLALPYLFAGIGITACLATGGRVHAAYLVNLVGSGAGCFLVFAALRPLGAPGLLLLVAGLAVFAGALFLREGSGRAARALVAAAGLAVAAGAVRPSALFPFRPDPRDQLSALRRAASGYAPTNPVETLFDAWDPTGRIEIVRFGALPANLPDPTPYLFYAQDGGAGSVLLGVESDLGRARGFFERTLYGAGYAMRGAPGARVLVIGVGGGPDIQTARHFGASSITGVEINGSAIAALAGPFARFTGDPLGGSDVAVARLDGRTFVRASREAFDLIVLSGVDTRSILAAGSLSISENHLYTIEAFDEYLDRLAPGGVLAVMRFGGLDRLRLSAIAVAALRARGATEPDRHFAVLEQGLWTSVLVGREPFPPAAIARLRAWTASAPPDDTGIRLPPYDVLGFALERPPTVLYPTATKLPADDRGVGGYFAAVASGRDRDFLDGEDFDLSPTTDDRPFFFDLQRKDRLFRELQPHYRVLGGFLLLATLFAGLFVAAPVPLFVRLGRAGRGRGKVLVYFGALGAGFMTIEIGLVQKLVLHLGHPSYAVSVVLATLLVAAGVGSGWAGRSPRAGSELVRRIAVPGILASGTLLFLALDHFGPAAARFPLELRVACAVAGMAPLGFFLGIPFPTGLAAMAGRAASLVPWAIGANGFTSVLGASAALPVAMLFGYRTVFAAGFALYLVAAVAFPRRSEVG